MNEILQPRAKGLLPSTLEWTVTNVDSDTIDALQVPFHSPFLCDLLVSEDRF